MLEKVTIKSEMEAILHFLKINVYSLPVIYLKPVA